jgi:hypothetical protein
MVFQGSDDSEDPADDRGGDPMPASALLPLVEFVAYAVDCILSGHVRLAADRLTDMLNQYDQIELVDVMVQRLDGLGAVEVKEIVARRDELLLVHATGPRGSLERRQRTRPHPLELKLGPYYVRGDLHAPLGHDPLVSIRRRKAMVPVTNAWIEYPVGGERNRRRVGALVVNRHQIDVIAPARDEWSELPDPSAHGDERWRVADAVGSIRRSPTGS